MPAVPLTLTPRYGHLFGSTPVIVTGPCFSSNERVFCEFGGKRSVGMFISEDQCLCATPLLSEIGEIDFTLRIRKRDGEVTFDSKFLTGKYCLYVMFCKLQFL